jgi:peptidoglycan/LPS O-acetylase OafA/YrhL
MSSDAMSSTSQTPPRLPALDALRAAGAAAVVGTHVGIAIGGGGSPFWGGVIARLDVGVAIFFVLSGFVLFRPYAYAAAHGTPRPGARYYLWRRALRILPAYWLMMTVCLVVLPGNAGASGTEWARYTSLTQIYTRAPLLDALGHAWSLATESAFYLVLPLLAVPLLGAVWRPGRTLAALCAGGVLITGGWLTAMALGWLDMGLHTMWLPSFGLWFAAGMALSTVRVALDSGTAPRRWQVFADLGRAPLACWGIAAGLFVIASTPMTGPRGLDPATPGQYGTRLVLFAAVAAAITMPAAFTGAGPVHRALSSPAARWLGTVSYGLFLWHPFVLTLLHPRLRAPDLGRFLGMYTAVMTASLGLAALSWYLLEQPVQRLGRRWRAAPAAVPAGSGSPSGTASASPAGSSSGSSSASSAAAASAAPPASSSGASEDAPRAVPAG